MDTRATRSSHLRAGAFGSGQIVAGGPAAESGEKGIRQGDDAVMRAGSIGIGMTEGAPFILGGARSAELLQLFIENL